MVIAGNKTNIAVFDDNKYDSNITLQVPIIQLDINPFYSENLEKRMFANSKDPDEMQHSAAFHQCLHCLQR